MYGEQTTKPKIFAYSTEVGNDNDGFWPIPERIFPLAEENLYLNKVLAWGPGVIDNPPHIYEANAYPSYCSPQEDSVHIFAIESNPENFTSTVTAYLYDSEDNLLEEFEMNEVNTNTYFTSKLSPQDEDFYYFLLLDKSSQLPSNFYYEQGLKFTTAGPVVLDSISSSEGSSNYFNIRVYVLNQGITRTITDASVRLICNDGWLTTLTPQVINLQDIPPGATVGTSSQFRAYYIDSLFPGHFNFKVEIMSDRWAYWTDSMQVIVGVEEELYEIPTEFSLSQNYPNPFNPSTIFRYSIPTQSKVIIKVYDILGNEIATLMDEEKTVGTYELTWKAASLPSGVYFYQLKAVDPSTGSGQSFIQTKKMILMK